MDPAKGALLAGLGNLHPPLVWLLLILIIGHVGGALYHRLVKHDDVLQRMLP